VHLQGEWKIDR